MGQLRVVFMGTGEFARPALQALLDSGHDVAGLVTQPDRPKGRSGRPTPPPLKPLAEARGVPVLQPHRVREDAARAELERLAPELLVVVAYGQILPLSLIESTPRGAINVHASLLPRLRGAAPIQWAIARGDAVTGVTTMQLDAGLDTGPILLQREEPIRPTDTAADLEPRLAQIGAELLLETLRRLATGDLAARPQDDAQSSLAPLLRKSDGRIDWTRTAAVVERRVRGFHPWPGSATRLGDRTVKVLDASVAAAAGAAPGEVVEVDGDGVVVACGDATTLRLVIVQPEGRRPMPAADFARGARLAPGARFA